jgi:hypothetical protein
MINASTAVLSATALASVLADVIQSPPTNESMVIFSHVGGFISPSNRFLSSWRRLSRGIKASGRANKVALFTPPPPFLLLLLICRLSRPVCLGGRRT